MVENKYRKWCNRCNRYHDSIPLDEKKLIEKHSRDIAIEIDKQVIETLKSIQRVQVAAATRMVASEI